ncbi:MAG: DNA primase, partial [Flavobacteriales bacterium]|nr:DNA primase [Flavobacteriales bacterium]
IDKIMDVAIIEEVIGEFVTLKKAGTSYKGLSPFTSEKTPSFFVVPHKGIYKCFSSSKGGNVVNFLMEHEKFSYPEALRWLAAKYNIEIEERELSPEEKEAQTTRESLGIVSEYAAKYFEDYLWGTDRGKAVGLSYLRERGLRDEIIKKFRLGYCPDEWDKFSKDAVEAGYELKYLKESGLTKETEKGPYDFFRGRVMFPIRNISGKVIAFGGRTLRSDKKVAKYFNSPESDLYDKSRVLYGIDVAKNGIVKEDLCYLVEGYTDVISLHQNEVENVVASAGTSLTEGQIRLIKRYTENVCMLFDGDAAGVRASFRGIDMLLQNGLNVRVVAFPDGEDPDSFARKTPSGEFIEFLKENADDFIVFKTRILSEDAAGDPIKKAAMISDIVDSIAVIPDGIKRSVYIKECSNLLEVEEATLVSELNKRLRKKFKKETGYAPIVDMHDEMVVQPITPEKVDTIVHQERDFIRLLLSYGNHKVEIEVESEEEEKVTKEEISVAAFLIHAIDEDHITFDNPHFQKVVDEYRKHLVDGTELADTHFTMHGDIDLSKAVADVLSERYQLSPNWQRHKIYPETEEMLMLKAVQDSIHRFKLSKVQKLIHQVNDQIKGVSDEEELMKLMTVRKKLDVAKAELSKYFGSVIVE